MNQLHLTFSARPDPEVILAEFDFERLYRQGYLKPGDRLYILGTPSGSLTWFGGGRKPRWVEEYLQNGGKLDDIEFQAPPRNDRKQER